MFSMLILFKCAQLLIDFNVRRCAININIVESFTHYSKFKVQTFHTSYLLYSIKKKILIGDIKSN